MVVLSHDRLAQLYPAFLSQVHLKVPDTVKNTQKHAEACVRALCMAHVTAWAYVFTHTHTYTRRPIKIACLGSRYLLLTDTMLAAVL